MKLSDFDYNLPRELIAQKPAKPRDHSRLLLLDKESEKIEHKYFYNTIDYLQKGDVLVLNNSKVFPARLMGKKEKGGKMEIFLLKKIRASKWQCLAGGRGCRVGLKIEFKKGLIAKILKNNQDGTWIVKFNLNSKIFWETIEKIGKIPLPPYIKRSLKETKNDKEDYQTIYADDKKIGSVAAPTAGFHFTPALLKKIKKKGVQLEYISLHVGLGTFLPVKIDNIAKHKMHTERVEIDKKTIARIYLAKKQKRRIVAVGTTSVRSLEALAKKFLISDSFAKEASLQFPSNSSLSQASKYQKKFLDFKENVDIFIYPGYKFRIVDAMITNFHLPKSTLLMLVSAFAGQKNIKKAYQGAIKNKYRFYSYGDSMFIH